MVVLQGGVPVGDIRAIQVLKNMNWTPDARQILTGLC